MASRSSSTPSSTPGPSQADSVSSLASVHLRQNLRFLPVAGARDQAIYTGRSIQVSINVKTPHGRKQALVAALRAIAKVLAARLTDQERDWHGGCFIAFMSGMVPDDNKRRQAVWPHRLPPCFKKRCQVAGNDLRYPSFNSRTTSVFHRVLQLRVVERTRRRRPEAFAVD
ncbi:hypothetical protein ANRL1_03846 [Anaerolineae bacterium]|nr:hypothetical protein ANRL1_03846 [Anaerolineae bacterium]